MVASNQEILTCYPSAHHLEENYRLAYLQILRDALFYIIYSQPLLCGWEVLLLIGPHLSRRSLTCLQVSVEIISVMSELLI